MEMTMRFAGFFFFLFHDNEIYSLNIGTLKCEKSPTLYGAHSSLKSSSHSRNPSSRHQGLAAAGEEKNFKC